MLEKIQENHIAPIGTERHAGIRLSEHSINGCPWRFLFFFNFSWDLINQCQFNFPRSSSLSCLFVKLFQPLFGIRVERDILMCWKLAI